MDNKRDILVYLLDNNILAPNPSRLAKELGRTDKQFLYNRLREANENDKAVLNLWENITTIYGMSDATLSHLPHLWQLTELMAKKLKERDFVNLCEYHLDQIADEEIVYYLRAIYKESVLDYGFVLALFFSKVRKLDPNTVNNSCVMIEVMQQVDAVLSKVYPEQEIVHQMVIDYSNQAQVVKFVGWCQLMLHVGRVICCYSHPYFLNEMREVEMQAMPFTEKSWWVDSQAEQDEFTIWNLTTCDEDSGIYDVLQIHAYANQPVRESDCEMQRWAFIDSGDVVRCMTIKDKKVTQSSYYNFELDHGEHHMILNLVLNKALTGKSVLPLPASLTRVREHTPWDSWIKKQNRDELDQIENHLFELSQGFELTDMEVDNVTIDRHNCVLTIKQPNMERKFVSLSIDQYKSLKTISPWSEVGIIRSIAEGSLYAVWDNPEIHIPITI